MLFWLEVESGNASRETLKRKTARRFEQARLYARRFSLSLVFALLAPPWVRQAVVGTFVGLPGGGRGRGSGRLEGVWRAACASVGISAGSVIGHCDG